MGGFIGGKSLMHDALTKEFIWRRLDMLCGN